MAPGKTSKALNLARCLFVLPEAALIDVCLHGVYETATTCAANHLAAVIANLDDRNGHMTRFFEWDVVRSPDRPPTAGRLPALRSRGLGFEIDPEGLERAKRAAAGTY